MTMATPTSYRSMSRTPYEQLQVPTKDPRQMELYQQVASALGPHLRGSVEGMGQMAAGGTPEQWAQLEAPAMRQYQQAIGGIGARYSGLGMGTQKSSAFQNELTGSAADLAERLQGNRMSLQQNAQRQLLELYKHLMSTDTFENLFMEKERRNPWGGLFSGATSGATAGSAFGPWGLAAGALLGGTAGYFGGR